MSKMVLTIANTNEFMYIWQTELISCNKMAQLSNVKSSLLRRFVAPLIYLLVYATLVTSLSECLSKNQTVIIIESAIYDGVQRFFTIDYQGNSFRYKQFEKHLETISAINLDANYFDLENERVRRDSLAKLLERLARDPKPEKIFLDYLFVPPTTEWDSALIAAIKSLEDRLVMPYELKGTYGKRVEDTKVTGKLDLIYEPKHAGYLYTDFFSNYDPVYRYIKTGPVLDTLPSCLDQLTRKIPGEGYYEGWEEVPDLLEINYVLRNEKSSHKRQGINIIDASQIVKDSNPLDLQKVIFIGLFDKVHGKYSQPIDEFPTPVSSEMRGIYRIINAYLNVISCTWLKKIGIGFVFGVNIILALTALGYLKKARGIWARFSAAILFFKIKYINTIIAALVFIFLIFGLYLIMHIKFPILIPTLFFVMNPTLYFIIKKSFYKKSSL
ncbi:MAG: CHASE2 domain-containing protein [Saprospiraceae bacterium]